MIGLKKIERARSVWLKVLQWDMLAVIVSTTKGKGMGRMALRRFLPLSLQIGGKVFIKFVLQALPTYVFSCFCIPKGILDDMISRMHRFWWVSKDYGCGWAMMS